MVVGVSWLTLYHVKLLMVNVVHYCSSCTIRNFFPFWKINWSVMLMTLLWRLLCHPQAFEFSVAETLIRDLGRVSKLCDLCGIKSNASNTKTIYMIVSTSHTTHPQSPPSSTQWKIFHAHYPWLQCGQWVRHGDTTDESPGLAMAFRQDRPPYSLEIHQWRPADNDPWSASETL